VFKLVKLLWRLHSDQTKIKISFKTPKYKDVLLVDARSFERIRLMLPSINYNLCYTEPAFGEMVIYASPSVIFYSLTAYFRSGISSITLAYLIGLIDATRPKIVIENIHFSIMLRAAQLRNKVSFITILNGYWMNGSSLIYGDDLFHKQLHKISKKFIGHVKNYHIIVFGKKDIEIFEDEGLSNEQTGICYHAFGSALADLAGKKYDAQCIPRCYDIVWVSQCDSVSIKDARFISNLLIEVTRKAFSFLVTYANDRQLNIHVHLRSDPGNDILERQFYQSISGEISNLSISDNIERPLSVYATAWRGSIICSIHSTLGFECLAWNKKVAFFLFDFVRYVKLSSSRHTFDAELWPWLFDGFSSEITHRLDALLALTDEEYSNQIREYQLYLIGKNLKQEAGESLQSLVDSILNS
jgi:hypothetical protein